jgi:hypothetical protein
MIFVTGPIAKAKVFAGDKWDRVVTLKIGPEETVWQIPPAGACRLEWFDGEDLAGDWRPIIRSQQVHPAMCVQGQIVIAEALFAAIPQEIEGRLAPNKQPMIARVVIQPMNFCTEGIISRKIRLS